MKNFYPGLKTWLSFMFLFFLLINNESSTAQSSASLDVPMTISGGSDGSDEFSFTTQNSAYRITYISVSITNQTSPSTYIIYLQEPDGGTTYIENYSHSYYCNTYGGNWTISMYEASSHSDADATLHVYYEYELINTAPVAYNMGTYSVGTGNTYTGYLSGYDADGNDLDYYKYDGPTAGSVSITSSNGYFSYTAPANSTGSTSFRYRSYDGQAYSNVATVSFSVSDNDNPSWSGCPSNVTQQTVNGDCYRQVGWTNPTASDNIGVTSIDVTTNPEVTVFNLGSTSFAQFAVGVTTVYYTAYDAAGNYSTCSFEVNIEDNEDPELTNCPADLGPFYIAPGETLSDYINWLQPTPSDNCPSFTFTSSALPYSRFPVGVNEVKFLVVDASGNRDSCSMNITVVDTVDPVAYCIGSATVYLDETGNISVDPADFDNGSTDNVSVAGFDLSQSSFDCSDLGANNITFTVYDQSGNTDNCNTTITVLDTISPTPQGRDLTVVLGASGNVTVPSDSMLIAGTFDVEMGIYLYNYNRLGLWMEHFPNGYGPEDLDGYQYPKWVWNGDFMQMAGYYTLNYYSNDGTWAYYYIDYTYENATPTAFSVFGETESATFGFGSSADNCGDVTVSMSDSIFSCSDVGANTITVTTTDGSNNVSQKSVTITVVDNEDPVATCQNITVYLDGNGSKTITASTIDNGSSDNCHIDSKTLNVYTFDCEDIGSNTVTLTVTDDYGNSDQCSATVTVADTTRPAISCSNVTVYLDGSGSASITVDDIDDSPTDNCSISTSELSKTSFSCSDVGDNDVTLTVTDVNSNVATCTATVTVVDTVNPTAQGQDMTVYLDESGDASISSSDMITGVTQSIYIYDADYVASNYVALLVSDFPDGYTPNDLDGETLNIGGTPVTFYLGTLNAYAYYTMNSPSQTSSPTFYEIFGEVDHYTFPFGDAETDNCEVITVTLSDSTFTCSDLGANTVTVTTKDQSDNTVQKNVTITVVDDEDPVASCQNKTVYLDGSGSVTITASAINNGSSDNCSIESATLDVYSFNCNNVGNNTVTLTVTDPSENTDQCTVTVTVVDTISPAVSCSNKTIYLDGSGSASITVDDIDNNSTDNCSIDTRELSKTSFSCSDVGDNDVTLTVTDVNSNVATCTATVTVVDTVNPTAQGQDMTIYLDENGEASISSSDMIENGIVANIPVFYQGGNMITLSKNVNWPQDFDGTYFDEREISTEDGIHVLYFQYNTSFDYHYYIDSDSYISSFDVTSVFGQTGPSINYDFMFGNQTDNCEVINVSLSDSTFTCSNVGTNTVTVTTKDQSDNTVQKNVTITVSDTISPVASCKNITVYLDENGDVSIDSTDVNNGSTDNCEIATIGLSLNEFSCSDIGDKTVTVTVTDVNGNWSTCQSTVTVEDTISPEAVCQDITIYLDETGNVSIDSSDVDNGSSDNCEEIASMTLDVSSFTCEEAGENTVTLTVTDANGNSDYCTSTVTVADTVKPIAVAKDTILYLDATGEVSFTASQLDGGSSDNCGISDYSIDEEVLGCDNIVGNVYLLEYGDQLRIAEMSYSVVTKSWVAVGTAMDVTDIDDNAFGIDRNPANGENYLLAGYNDDGTAVRNLYHINMVDDEYDYIDQIVSQSGETHPQDMTFDKRGNLYAVFKNGEIDRFTLSESGNEVIESQSSFADVGQEMFEDWSYNGAVGLTYDYDNDRLIYVRGTSATSFSVVEVLMNGTANLIYTLDAPGVEFSSTYEENVLSAQAIEYMGNGLCLVSDSWGNDWLYGLDLKTGEYTFLQQPTGSGLMSVKDLMYIPNKVELTVTDYSGNSSTANAYVTILDTISPVLSVTDITVAVDSSGSVGISAADLVVGASDNCTVLDTLISIDTFNCSDIGEPIEVLVTLWDSNGNKVVKTANVTVIDTIKPVAQGQDITLYLDENGEAAINFDDLIISEQVDNCCGTTVTWHEIEIGTFGSTNGLGIALYGWPEGYSHDYFDGKTLDVYGDEYTLYYAYDSDTRIYYAVDNTFSGEFDETPDAGEIFHGEEFFTFPFESLTCEYSIALSDTTFTCADAGENTVTVYTTDSHNNVSEKEIIVTVLDTLNPVVSCQSATVYLDGNGIAEISVADVNDGSADNCEIDTMTLSQTSFDCSAVLTNPLKSASGVSSNEVTLYVTDVHGNIDSCVAEVTVLDTISPVVVCQNLMVAPDINGNTILDASMLDYGSGDNCSIDTMYLSKYTFGPEDVGNTVSVTLTGVDISGNESSCVSNILINDTIAPTAICRHLNFYDIDDLGGVVTVTPALIDNGSYDGSGISSYSVDKTTFTCADEGETEVTLTVIDNFGNVSTCTTTVTVNDRTAPIIYPIDDIEVELAEGKCEAELDYPEIVVDETCDVTFTLLSGLGSDGATFPIGTTTEVWEVKDIAGNADTVSFNITVTGASTTPSINAIHDIYLDIDEETAVIRLSGIYDVGCTTDELNVTASTDDVTIITNLTVDYTNLATTGLLTIELEKGVLGSATITVRVENNEGGVAEEQFVVNVIEINDVPSLFFPVADQVVNAARELRIPLSPVSGEYFIDAEDEVLSLSVHLTDSEELPVWASIVNDTLVCTPLLVDTGCVEFVVEASDVEGASASDTFTICVEGYVVGVDVLDKKAFDVNMYPNPSRGNVTLSLGKVSNETELWVMDIAGRIVFNKTYSVTDEIRIDLGREVSGMYFVRMNLEGELVTKKLILKK